MKALQNSNCVDKTEKLGSGGNVIMITPPVGEDYWLFKVELSPTQAIIAFPKFCTLGVGFKQEEDWNTNLPYQSSTREIWNHIKDNKGDENIKDSDCIRAIELIKEACADYHSKHKNL